MITNKIALSKSAWAEQKAKLKARFPKLTDSDLDFDLDHKK
jgi:hypothetical protein